MIWPFNAKAEPAKYAIDSDDAEMLDRLQKAAFDYFAKVTNPRNGPRGDLRGNGRGS